MFDFDGNEIVCPVCGEPLDFMLDEEDDDEKVGYCPNCDEIYAYSILFKSFIDDDDEDDDNDDTESSLMHPNESYDEFCDHEDFD